MTDHKRPFANTAFPAMPPVEIWPAWSNMVKMVEPVANGLMRANLELSSLAAARTRAYVALPRTLTQCRSPVDLFQAQMAFWQEAGHQYTQTTSRVVAALQSSMPAVSPDAWSQKTDERDYITFPEMPAEQPRSETAQQDKGRDDRRRGTDGRRAA